MRDDRSRERFANLCLVVAIVLVILYAASGGDLSDR